MVLSMSQQKFWEQYHGKTMSFNDAISLIKIADTLPTQVGSSSVGWVNAKTGSPVTIGYTGGTNKIK